MESEEVEYQCSECGTTVRSNATICTNCGSNLEENPEEEISEDDREDLIEIPIPSEPAKLTAILSLLDENQIEYSLYDGSTESVWGPNFIQLPRLMVHKDQVETVTEIIENIEEEEIEVIDSEVFKDPALEKQDNEKKLKGVEGVLFGLCLLMILGPIATIPYFIYDFILYQNLFNRFTSIYASILLDLLFSIYLAYLSINAGIKLYKILPNAVQLANRFFVILIVYQVVSFLTINIVFSVNNIPFNSETINIYDGLITETISSITFSLISITYLKNSERVKNTFGIQ